LKRDADGIRGDEKKKYGKTRLENLMGTPDVLEKKKKKTEPAVRRNFGNGGAVPYSSEQHNEG